MSNKIQETIRIVPEEIANKILRRYVGSSILLGAILTVFYVLLAIFLNFVILFGSCGTFFDDLVKTYGVSGQYACEDAVSHGEMVVLTGLISWWLALIFCFVASKILFYKKYFSRKIDEYLADGKLIKKDEK